MRHFPILFLLISSCSIWSQQNPEIFILDFKPAYEGFEFLNLKNISNNEGYDNQPSFSTDNLLLYAGNNNGQTDIFEYNLDTHKTRQINRSTSGGEYSPQSIPTSTDIAAVRLEPDGIQRLYKYNSKTGASDKVFEDLSIAYFTFYQEDVMLATVLSKGEMDLTLIDLAQRTVDTLFQNAGRTLQKVPNSNSMSYTLVNDNQKLDLYILDMDSLDSYFICELPKGTEDVVWINSTQILTAMGSYIYLYDTLGEGEWQKTASLEEYNIGNISRMAISPNGKKLAVVAESK